MKHSIDECMILNWKRWPTLFHSFFFGIDTFFDVSVGASLLCMRQPSLLALLLLLPVFHHILSHSGPRPILNVSVLYHFSDFVPCLLKWCSLWSAPVPAFWAVLERWATWPTTTRLPRPPPASELLLCPHCTSISVPNPALHFHTHPIYTRFFFSLVTALLGFIGSRNCQGNSVYIL